MHYKDPNWCSTSESVLLDIVILLLADSSPSHILISFKAH